MEEKVYRELRERMVTTQILSRGVRNPYVIKAMKKVPRHKFVEPPYAEDAYSDYPLQIGCGQTISQPYMVAVMTELIEPEPEHRVLEIGTGSGYQSAVLAEIVKEVYSVERCAELASKAQKVLNELGYTNVKIKVDDGTQGWEEHAPYDGIIVTAGAPEVPKPLIEQLREGGRLVIPIGSRFSQMLVRVTKRGNKLDYEELFGCVFVPLIGKFGFKE